MDKNKNKLINSVLEGMQDDWDNLKKSRFITLKLCKKYKYNSLYNYCTDSEKKEDIFNKSFLNKINFEETNNLQYLELDNLNKICVDLESIYNYFLDLANVRHGRIGSDTVIFFSNDENQNESFMQSIVKDLHTVKTKKRPIGIIANNQNELLKKIEQIDKELGYIDEKGYIGERIEGLDKSDDDEIDVEKFLNNASDYIKKVLKADISNVELHQYYKYLINTMLPNKHIHIIPFLKGENYENIQYLIGDKTKKDKNEFFLYSIEEERFKKISPEYVKTIDGKLVGKRANGEKNLQEYLTEKFDIER